MSDSIKAPDGTGRVRYYSIARKLNTRMFWRLLGLFIWIDILLGVITGIGLIVYSEYKAEASAKIIAEYGIPPADPAGWLRMTGLEIAVVTGEPPGVRLPEPFSYPLPKITENAKRNVTVTSDLSAPFFRRLDGVAYNVYPVIDGTAYHIAVSLGPFFRIFKYALIALFICEFISLLSRAAKDRRMVRRTLDPITELTRAAQNLNAVSSQLDPEKMAALAGKLEGINAARLDTRIQVDETQDELKNLARAINSMLDRINESYRAQVRFVSDASHELRTPISVIQGYANLLDRWGKNDEKTLQESINAIKDEAANMKDLIEQLLFLARGDNNTIMLQAETFNLSDLIREVCGETRMIDTSHEFETRLGDAWVSADRALIKQAARILVDNAVKYTDPGGQITLSTALEDGRAKLKVTDTGIGIPPEIVPRIFDRFYRADESRARATGGSGLGLSIAKWITSRHGGFMEVLSREGIGTKISIALPAAGMELSVPKPEAAAAETV
ncbi:MAG: HAMP domain-containing protein [Clostridiales bacterium]|nr:HAMP domain-containing protein [Clostridiales bacterium]